ncbi:MAG: hypothetical protein U0228_38615 [Myxococcaceae bacterium]
MVLAAALAAAPVVSAPADPPEPDCDSVPLFGVVLLPGAHFGSTTAAAGSGYIEFRPFEWAGLRTGAELSRAGYSIDFLGIKLSPLAHARFRPYLAGAVSADFPANKQGQSYLGFAGAVGLDVTLGAGFYLEAEGRMRAFKGTGLQGGAFLGLGFEFL